MGIGIIVGVALCPVLFATAKAPEASYNFVTVDHPISMWSHGTDKWAYYGLKDGKIEETAKVARAELLAAGYKEDLSRKPWYCFVKGKEEVVVCYHDQFEVSGSAPSKSTHPSRPGTPPSEYICVLVKNGPGTGESLPLFQVKKLIHGW